jgi:Coenzyme PQQ synthesis protein D (PqqD)
MFPKSTRKSQIFFQDRNAAAENRPHPEARLLLSPDARVSVNPLGIVFMNAKIGKLWFGNQVAREIVNCLCSVPRVSDIAATLRNKYDISAEQAMLDTEQFVAQLRLQGLVTISEERFS